MNAPFSKIILFIVIILTFAKPVKGELIHGYSDFVNGGFDFSTQQNVAPFYLADVVLSLIFDPPLGWWLSSFNYSGILMFPDSSLSELTTAPSDSTLYLDNVSAVEGVTYVVRTSDDLYAKFELTSWIPYTEAIFEYYVQMDGSTNLDSTVPVHPSTWGQIKALYR